MLNFRQVHTDINQASVHYLTQGKKIAQTLVPLVQAQDVILVLSRGRVFFFRFSFRTLTLFGSWFLPLFLTVCARVFPGFCLFFFLIYGAIYFQYLIKRGTARMHKTSSR